MTFPKYFYLYGNKLQPTDFHENFLKDIQQHESFVYSFLKALLEAWKQIGWNTNHAVIQEQLYCWKQQLWLEIGQRVYLDTSPSQKYFFDVLHGLWEWVFYKARVGNANELNNIQDCYSLKVEDVHSVSSHSPLKVGHGNKKPSSSAVMTKYARKVLNDWFHANMHHPYPSEKVKRELAHEAGITVEQVNTFFGNKRMRTKRKLAKLFQQQHQDTDTSGNFSPRFRWQKLIFPQLVELEKSKISTQYK
ncbi:homeobox protein [Galdieria sulphuraria]|uniref:Homeobox protein n=1 Tax=Galdieria sulphuraria TaxID=130081 RepID=M2Y8M5_GALSU|nr:homeobox protein [Galdieria sulphuraria]EME32194.1 homeobox protein [Galdieria sulphuraria]|eukprot:XP_005708714.1 homeobox protein [Galdieria sulphuraria]